MKNGNGNGEDSDAKRDLHPPLFGGSSSVKVTMRVGPDRQRARARRARTVDVNDGCETADARPQTTTCWSPMPLEVAWTWHSNRALRSCASASVLHVSRPLRGLLGAFAVLISRYFPHY